MKAKKISKKTYLFDRFNLVRVIIIFLISLYTVIVASPNIIFANYTINNLANISLGILIAFLVLLIPFKQDSSKRAITTFLFFGIFISIPLLLLSGFLGLRLFWNEEGFFKPTSQLQTKDYQILIYNWSGGATVDYSSAIKQQWTIFPGLLYTNTIFQKYHCRKISVEVVKDNIITYRPCSNDSKPITVSLKRFFTP